MPVDAILHNELERLADVARHEIEASPGTSVADPFSPEAREACAAITTRLVEAGVDRVIAEWATTYWIVGSRHFGHGVWQCKEQADYHAELGLIRPAGGAA